MAEAIIISKGASISAAEVERVEKALALLEKDNHAPREIALTATLHVHKEYPKHVTVGKDEDGKPIVKIVGSPEDEKAVLAETKKVPSPAS
jgi:hypothetical protein